MEGSRLLNQKSHFFDVFNKHQACSLRIYNTFYLFIFYISFEGITIPTFFLVYLFGAELTKIKASIVFLISSFFLCLITIIYRAVSQNVCSERPIFLY